MDPKILISYVYYERENTKTNLEFFLKHGLKDNITMIINVKSSEINIDVSQYKNVILYLSKNTGFDFGGHRDNLSKVNFNNYNYFVLMNDGCMGPFYKKGNWYDPFIEKMSNVISLVGTHGIKRYSCGRNWRVGSWFLFIDKNIIHDFHNMLKRYAPTIGGKRGYLQCLLIEKKHIGCFLAERQKKHDFLVKGNWKDYHTPSQTVFVKENRVSLDNSHSSLFKIKKSPLNYITREVLNKAINYMNNENRNK